MEFPRDHILWPGGDMEAIIFDRIVLEDAVSEENRIDRVAPRL